MLWHFRRKSVGRKVSRIKAVCRTSPATTQKRRQAKAFRDPKGVTFLETCYQMYARVRNNEGTSMLFRSYEKCYQRKTEQFGIFELFDGTLSWVENQAGERLGVMPPSKGRKSSRARLYFGDILKKFRSFQTNPLILNRGQKYESGVGVWVTDMGFP